MTCWRWATAVCDRAAAAAASDHRAKAASSAVSTAPTASIAAGRRAPSTMTARRSSALKNKQKTAQPSNINTSRLRETFSKHRAFCSEPWHNEQKVLRF